MGFNRKFADQLQVIQVIPTLASQTVSSGALVGTTVDARTFGRVAFIFNLGTPAAGASVNSLHIWCAPTTTSGGTYTMISGASTGVITTGVGSNQTVRLEVAVPANSAWLKISGALSNSHWPVSCVAILEQPSGKSPTEGSAVVVSV